MDNFINVNKKDPHVRINKNDMLDKYDRLTYDYQSELGYAILNTLCRYSNKCMYISSINTKTFV